MKKLFTILSTLIYCLSGLSVRAQQQEVIIFTDGLTATSQSAFEGGYNTAGIFASTAANNVNDNGVYSGASSAKTITSSATCTLSLPPMDSIGVFRFYVKAVEDITPEIKIRIQDDGGDWVEVASLTESSKTYVLREVAINVAKPNMRIQIYVKKMTTEAGYYFDDFHVTKCFKGSLRVFQFATMFSNNMVLQRDKPVQIWGIAPQGEEVTLSINGHKVSAIADANDQWSATLPAMTFGGPYLLTLTWNGGQKSLSNVLIGDVWVAGGQSNMDFALRKVTDAANEIAKADEPNIRFLRVPKDYYLGHNKAWIDWEVCTPAFASEMFAVPYYYARKVYQETGIPIGIVQCALGGTSAESWLPQELLLSDPAFSRTLVAYNKVMAGYKLGEYEELYAKWKAGTITTEPTGPYNFRRPAGVYYTMFEKIVPYTIKGFLWYQGESNVARAHDYIGLFPALIKHWRDRMGQGDIPFLFVQLPKFASSSYWQELREAQRLTELSVANTGMSVSFDQGNPSDIHPTRKDTVGERLAYVGLAKVYNHKIPYSGPKYQSMEVVAGEVKLTFDCIEGGLTARSGVLKGFSICGESKIFYPAEARIEGEYVYVSSSRVPVPLHVRYGWFSSGEMTLYDLAGLPASPFRTDNYPFMTETVQEGGASQESSLSSILVNGVPLSGFTPALYSYIVRVTSGSGAPVVSALAADENATVGIEQAEMVTGTLAQRTAIIRVTAEDLLTVSEYTVTFEEGDAFAQIVVDASQSTWVNMSSKDANYARQDMQLRTWASNFREIYLQFDLSTLSDIQPEEIKSVKVCLTFKDYTKPNNSSTNPERRLLLNLAYDTLRNVSQLWKEETLTWNNRPNPSAPLLLSSYNQKESTILPNSTIDFTLSDLAIFAQKLSSDQRISFYLRESSEATTSTTKEGMLFYSSNSAPNVDKRPRLMVETSKVLSILSPSTEQLPSLFSVPDGIVCQTEAEASLSIFTPNGSKVATAFGRDRLYISLPKGLYIVGVTTDKTHLTRKILLQ